MWTVSLFLASLFYPLIVFSADKALCDHIFLKEGSLRLNENERILVCGTSKAGEGWRHIPLPQSQWELNNILQSQGYFKPRFERDIDRLFVWSGPRSEANTLQVQGDQHFLRPEKKRKILGYPLTSEKLNEVRRWAEQDLRSQGFACHKIQVEAHAWDASLHVDVEPLPRQRIGALSYTGLEGLHVDTFLRYRAFEPGDIYDIRETRLTTERLLADGLFQSAYYVTDCQGDQVNLELRASVGRPRIFQFGIGASTEEFPFTDISFRNARLDHRASSFAARLYASNIRQSLDFRSELYWFIGYPQLYFGPRFRTERQSENAYEALLSKAGADIGLSWDRWNIRFQGRFGPTLNYANTVRGFGPANATYTSLEGNLNFQNHVYELFFRDQYEGWSGNLQVIGNRRGLGSEFSVDRYDLNFKYLWNLGAYSPPLLVLGTRFQGSMVLAREQEAQNIRDALPLEYRIFYGGDDNLRGFARKSLNNRGLGYLTAVYLGFELRLVEQLPHRLQPLLLWDLGRMGDQARALDPPVFISEGVGLRWATIFGSLRGSIARGRIWSGDQSTQDYAQQWIYFLSYGQEF